jgi:hydrogenase nickel incorporation protein HypA/HybF
MHELSLAMSVVDFLKQLSKEKGLTKVEAVYLEVGDMAYVDPAQLRYSFKIASQGTVAEKSRLYIKRRKVVLRCTKCGRENEFRLESLSDFRWKCPCCGSPDVEIDKGKELLLKRVKGSR